MSNINFDASNHLFRGILGNGKTFRVPSFQRDYSWTEDELNDLWEDIILVMSPDSDDQAHYMGYLVLQSSNSKNFDIIDGQQRIATICMLVAAALKVMEKDNSHDSVKRQEMLRNTYLGYVSPITLLPEPKLELNRHNNNFYKNCIVGKEPMPIRNLTASEKLMKFAFKFFEEKIHSTYDSDSLRITTFIDSMVDKLFFTVITVTDELNAFRVFETLNARGVRLSSTDLLKNYLLSLVFDGSNRRETEELEERWEKIVSVLGSEDFPEFLRNYWNSFNRTVRKSELFKVIRKKITEKRQVFELMREMDQYANIYAALRAGTDDLWQDSEKQLRDNVDLLNVFGVKQQTPVLLAMYKYLPGDFEKVLNYITIMAFRYNIICGLHTNELEYKYNQIALKISNGELKTVAAIKSMLLEIYPNDKQFKSSFETKELPITSRNKKIAKYILCRIEKEKSGVAPDIDDASVTIEHVFPINPDDKWPDFNGRSEERSVYAIGNYTLLKVSDNRLIGNSSYVEKKTVYHKSGYSMTREIADMNEEWTPMQIKKRQEEFAKLAAQIWTIN